MVVLLLTLLACTPKEDGTGAIDTAFETTFSVPTGHYALDDVLRFNEVQARGTHNSTHIEPANPVDPSHEYTHKSLTEQLDSQGVRQFELDLHLHKELGLQVFHLPGIDQETVCLQFTDCLQEIKDWSNANPLHTPIMIWMELKDEDLDTMVEELDSLSGNYDLIEDDILSVFPRFRVMAPDDVRGDHATLPQAINADGWPTLGELRGRVVFSLLENDEHRDLYLAGRQNLEGALLFVDADTAEDPWAATFKINNADNDFDRIQDLVSQGFVVTCNADGADDTPEENAFLRDRSLASGAQYLSSDRPAPESGGDGYWLEIPGGSPARCNPVRTHADCTSADVESLP